MDPLINISNQHTLEKQKRRSKCSEAHALMLDLLVKGEQRVVVRDGRDVEECTLAQLFPYTRTMQTLLRVCAHDSHVDFGWVLDQVDVGAIRQRRPLVYERARREAEARGAPLLASAVDAYVESEELEQRLSALSSGERVAVRSLVSRLLHGAYHFCTVDAPHRLRRVAAFLRFWSERSHRRVLFSRGFPRSLTKTRASDVWCIATHHEPQLDPRDDKAVRHELAYFLVESQVEAARTHVECGELVCEPLDSLDALWLEYERVAEERARELSAYRWARTRLASHWRRGGESALRLVVARLGEAYGAPLSVEAVVRALRTYYWRVKRVMEIEPR